MILLDYIIGNTDRHWNNFGIIRDSNTGKWLKPIPIYDNGYSMWNNNKVNAYEESNCSSFADTNENCMKFINKNDYSKSQKLNEQSIMCAFDAAFACFPDENRKNEIRQGLLIKRTIISKYLDIPI